MTPTCRRRWPVGGTVLEGLGLKQVDEGIQVVGGDEVLRGSDGYWADEDGSP